MRKGWHYLGQFGAPPDGIAAEQIYKECVNRILRAPHNRGDWLLVGITGAYLLFRYSGFSGPVPAAGQRSGATIKEAELAAAGWHFLYNQPTRISPDGFPTKIRTLDDIAQQYKLDGWPAVHVEETARMMDGKPMPGFAAVYVRVPGATQHN